MSPAPAGGFEAVLTRQANSVAARNRNSRLRPAQGTPSLRDLSAEYVLLISWVISTRVFTAEAAKFGVHIGPAPLFWTDFVLLGLLAFALAKRPATLLVWFSCGAGAGALGRPVWLLAVAVIIYFELAFPEYGVFAARDLAIFGYSLFYPLTYWVLRSRFDAMRMARCFVYAGALPALAAIFDVATGSHFLLGVGERSVFSSTVVRTIGGGDFGGICAFSVSGLIAYVLLERRGRKWRLCLAAVSLLGLIAATTRSATLGLGAAILLSALLLGGRFRFWAFSAAALAVITGVLIAIIPHGRLENGFLGRYLLALGSAFAGQADADGAFRLARWRYTLELWRRTPLFGIGFGAPLLPYWVAPEEFQAGLFNGGMPHNTFLFLMARMGLLGLCLIVYAWRLGLARVIHAFRLTRGADELAVANILLAMMVFAAFVLFFERPVNGPALWIMLAVAVRLAEYSQPKRRLASPVHNLIAMPLHGRNPEKSPSR